MGCKLPTGMPPEELTSIKTFSMEDPPDEQREAKEEYEPPKKKTKKAKDKKPMKDVKSEVQKEVSLEVIYIVKLVSWSSAEIKAAATFV